MSPWAGGAVGPAGDRQLAGTAGEDPAISVRGLRKAYGETLAVDGVSFTVERGEIFGLIGPNGSGKTTIVECVQGLRNRDEGEVRVLGLDPATHSAELRRRIGSQLQESALPDRLKVWEALDLFAALASEPADWRRLLEEWGLSDRREASFASLSGGERQRLLVALALVNEPEVVFLDEMTTGLDPAARRVAWGLIEALRERRSTVVLVTHFMDEAERLCDRLAVLRKGRIVALDTPEGLIAAHTGEARVSFTLGDGDISWLHEVPHVAHVRRRDGRVEVEGSGPLVVHLCGALLARATVPADLRVERGTLEDVFLALTGGETEG
jgi:ABC-2 type transport system ATP-binding protein